MKSLTGLYGDHNNVWVEFPIVSLEFDPDTVQTLGFNVYNDSNNDEGCACCGFEPIVTYYNDKSHHTLPLIGLRQGNPTTLVNYGLSDRYQAFAGATGNDDGASKVSSVVSTFTISGEQGGSFGLLGYRQSNGPGWNCSPPDGSDGVLMGFSAQLCGPVSEGSETAGGAMMSIGFIWRYSRVVPKGMSVPEGMWLTDLVRARKIAAS